VLFHLGKQQFFSLSKVLQRKKGQDAARPEVSPWIFALKTD
jgi:hypothetical protein